MNQPSVMRDETGLVELRIPRKAEWVAVARLALAAVASRLRFSLEDIEDVKLAIAEACTNSIQHGDESGQIEITCETSPQELRVTVIDRGASRRPDESARADDEEPVGGLGIFIIRSLMDTVDYSTDPGSGSRLLMTKRVAV